MNPCPEPQHCVLGRALCTYLEDSFYGWTLPCAGDIIQQGINKVAVYKDESGNAQGFKAACPHLVCSQLLMIFM